MIRQGKKALSAICLAQVQRRLLPLAGALLSALLLAPAGHATEWTGNADDDWFNDANWTAGVPEGFGPFGPAIIDTVSPNPTVIDGGFADLSTFGWTSLDIGLNGTGMLTVRNGGVLDTSGTSSGIRVAVNPGSQGTLNVGAAAGDAPAVPGEIIAGNSFRPIDLGAGGTLVFNHTDNSGGYQFSSFLTGTGQVDVLAGTTAFTTDSGGFGGTFEVASGATLAGQSDPTLGGTLTVLDGGILAVDNSGAPGTLTVNDLVLNPGSILRYELGAPDGDPGVDGDFLVVNGDATINDAILEAVDLGGFDEGTYTLIQLDGALNGDWGFSEINLPGGFNGTMELDTFNGNDVLNLVAGGELGEEAYWDGGDLAPDGTVDGGDGVWNNTSTNWTTADGSANAAWNEQIAVFAGAPGTVSVVEDVAFTRLRFETDGYVIEGNGGSLLPNTGELNAGEAPRVEIPDASTTATIDAAIGGDRGLRKDGGGTLVFVTDQAYTGLTDIRGGMVQLGEGGTSGMVFGDADIFAGSTLAFNRSDDPDFDGVIGGGGDLIQMGGGELTLTADSGGFGGQTLVQSGSVRIVDALGGDAVIDSGNTLLVDGQLGGSATAQGSTIVVGTGGSIGGSADVQDGTLDVSGGEVNGNVNLAGSTFSLAGGAVDGAVTAANSTLDVADSQIDGDIDLTNSDLALDDGTVGNVDVRDGSRLAGLGTVGTPAVNGVPGVTIRDGGTLAPGAGTLTIDGDLVFEEGATYEIEAAPDGTAGRVDVIGNFDPPGALDPVRPSHAILNGNVVALASGPASGWQPFTEFEILTTDDSTGTGGIEGEFDSAVEENFAFLDAVLSYEPNRVTLTLERNDIAFDDLATTGNQAAAGTAASELSVQHPLVGALFLLTDKQVPDALAALSGEVHASTKTLLFEDSRLVRDTLLARSRTTDNPGGTKLWGQVLGARGSTDADNGTAELDRDTEGFFVGGDHGIGEADYRFGWMAGYTRGAAEVDARDSESETDNIHLAIYGGKRLGAPSLGFGAAGSLGLRLGAAHSWHEVETDRTVAFPGFSESLESDYDADSTQFFGEVDYRLKWDDTELAPFAGLAYTRVSTDGFFEGNQRDIPYGETATLWADASDEDQTYATLGMRGAMPFGNVRLDGTLGWRHAFDDLRPETTFRFLDGNQRFTTQGAPVAQDVALVGLGAEGELWPGADLALSYNGQFASEATDHAVRLRLQIGLE